MTRAHNDQRYGIETFFLAFEFAKKLRTALEVAIDDEGVNLRVAEPLEGRLRFSLHRNLHVETPKDAFQNADFLPVARNYHRGKDHGPPL